MIESLVSIVTVTYNSGTVLPGLLESLPRGMPIIVVDNGSDDADLIDELAVKHRFHFIRNKENVGLGCACNLGAAQIESELILFLNPDAVLVDGAIEHLAYASQKYLHASAFSPAIMRSNGKQYFRRSSVIAPQEPKLPKGWPEGDCEIPVLSGAAFAVRRADFETIGGFDPNIFLYHEDDDLSLRLKAECGPLMFVRQAKIVHQGGQSSGSSPAVARMKGRHMGYSRVYTSLKHGTPLAFERAILSAIGEICLLPRLVSSRRRAKSLGYLAGILGARHLAASRKLRAR